MAISGASFGNETASADNDRQHHDPDAAAPTHASQSAPPCLPPEILRHHLAPKLAASALRAFRRVSRGTRDDAAACAVTAIKRPPGTHPLPPDLGSRFPRLSRLDLSGDTQLGGGLSLFQALQSASGLTSLSMAGCSGVPASFIARQLTVACPRLQHLALSCCCSAPPDTETALMGALAAAPLAATLTSLELHCGGAFQPELRHLDGLAASLRSLRVYGNRMLDDDALAALPRFAPALVELHLGEQHSRRGRHIRGDGLRVLAEVSGLRALSLACPEPDPRRMAAALATLTQLTELDLSRCEPRLVEATAPLAALVGGGGGESVLRRLLLPTAYTTQQLARGVPAALGAAGGSGGSATAAAAAGLQSLRLHASAALPEEVVAAMSRLVGLSELSLSHCGPPGRGATAAAAALTRLTSFHLVQEYGGGDAIGDEGDHGTGGGCASRGPGPAAEGEGVLGPASSGGDVVGGSGGGGGVAGFTWYNALPSWRLLRHLILTDVDTLDDGHLYDMGRSLTALSYFSLSRNLRVCGDGFSSWPAGCRRLTALALYDCARVGDAAVAHLAALPLLRTMALAHLPGVGADGVLRLAAGCTTLRCLTLERLAGAPGSSLAALWRLPLLETLSLRMCTVTNLTLEEALGCSKNQNQPDPREGGAAAAVAAAAPLPPAAITVQASPPVESPLGPAAAETQGQPQGGGSGDEARDGAMEPAAAVAAVAPCLSWLELQGTLVTTSGVRALRHSPGLTHLDLSSCMGVGDGIWDVLMNGGGVAPPQTQEPPGGGGGGAAATTAGAALLPLLPSLVHVDLRGCLVTEATVERLRAAGLAVNTGAGAWR